MENRRKIKITDIQYEDGERRKSEMTVWGVFSGTDGDFRLNYDESFGEDMRAHTEIRVKDSCVCVERSGDINSTITLQRGRRHNCRYQTPYGDILLEIIARQVDSQVNAGRGRLRLVYEIDYKAGQNSVKEMLIEIDG